MADGKVCKTVTTSILRLDTDTGLSGWGEVCPIPRYLAAYADGVLPALQPMAPEVLGADPIGPEALMGSLDGLLPGHAYAKSIIDIALWDLTAKAESLPLHTLLGGGLRSGSLPLYHSITCLAPDEMARMAREAQQTGIGQFQVKLGADSDWQADAERLVKVREAVGSGPLVYGDWNCGAGRLQATRAARAVAHHDIMLEQPCDTLAECAAVLAATGLPMKLDEVVFDTASLLAANETGCMDAAAIKLSTFGGLSACRRARDLCEHFGTKMCIEDTWGSDIVTAASLHLAAATDPAVMLNVCDLSGYVSPRSTPRRRCAPPGASLLRQGIGLGVELDLDQLGRPMAVLD